MNSINIYVNKIESKINKTLLMFKQRFFCRLFFLFSQPVYVVLFYTFLIFMYFFMSPLLCFCIVDKKLVKF